METRLHFFQANPAAMQSLSLLEERMLQAGFEPVLAELVRLRAAQLNGCAYCVDMHALKARKAGAGERMLASLCVWRDTPWFSARERAALAWTEALTLVAGARVPDAVWAEVQPSFTAAELVDLTLLVCLANTWNRFAIGFRKPLAAADGATGAAPL
ncbi:carboxymuconolactone decarboxylase family protein [Massilia sp. SM-13]|uniref:carboxymuconolactone decarboxylase family protein n=1 Tax=Pseudoduganella rhizocola TaxID=3382643 RepID=UPI0038B562BA